MSQLTLVILVLLVAAASAFRLKDKGRHYYDEGKPEMLLERGLIPGYEDDPEVYRDTAWLLDKIIMDGAEIVRRSEAPVVIYRFPSGNKQECIDGKKTIPAQCQWTGWVVPKAGAEPEELKLTVAKKYCTEAGFDRPKDEVRDC